LIILVGNLSLPDGFTSSAAIGVYFCDPKSPWQRATSENTKAGSLGSMCPGGSILRVACTQRLDKTPTGFRGVPNRDGLLCSQLDKVELATPLCLGLSGHRPRSRGARRRAAPPFQPDIFADREQVESCTLVR
jgi:hypothetical protein